MRAEDQPFVVGRRTRRGTTVILLRRDPEAEQPIPGPWTLRAVITRSD